MRLAEAVVVAVLVVEVEQEDYKQMFLALQPFQLFNTLQDY
jgi:hypothetical protein